MKDIKQITEQYMRQEPTTIRSIQGEYITLIHSVGVELSQCRKIHDVEKYLTIMHLLVLGNSSTNQAEKKQYLHMGEMLWDMIE